MGSQSGTRLSNWAHSMESERESRSVVSDSLRPHGPNSPWNSPGQNTGMGSLSLLQGIFSTQGSNPGLPHCRQILYCLSHHGSPRILGWVAYPFSGGSSQSRNGTGVFCIAGRFFTSWATGEAHRPRKTMKRGEGEEREKEGQGGRKTTRGGRRETEKGKGEEKGEKGMKKRRKRFTQTNYVCVCVCAQ